MAAVDFYTKAGDTLPVLLTTLLDSTGSAIDLTDAVSVAFKMAADGADTLTVDSSANIVGPPTAGEVQYAWQAGDTDVAGSYNGAFVVTYATGEQTFPSAGFISILIQPNLTSDTDSAAPFCTVADVTSITGRGDVDPAAISVAWSVVESVTGRPLYELTGVLEGDKIVLTDRDQYWLQRAIAWQSVWVTDNPDVFSAFDVTNTAQSGSSGTFNVDGLVVAPMCRRALRWITWTKTRSVKIQRPFPYARLLNPTATDDLGHPWSGM